MTFPRTLRLSGISLGQTRSRRTRCSRLEAELQTVHHADIPEADGMILAMKELVDVDNVPASAVRTVGQQRAERKDS